jgi:hypothetical protein
MWKMPVKEPELMAILRSLHPERTSWYVVDEWKVDRSAIGIASPAYPHRVFYLSVFRMEPGIVTYGCEVRDPDDRGLVTVEEGVVSTDEVLHRIYAYLEGIQAPVVLDD